MSPDGVQIITTGTGCFVMCSLVTNYGHFGPKTLRTLDTSALVWWVRTVRTDRHWCRSVLKTVRTQVPNCLAPSAEVSWPVFDDYGVQTDPKARLTETAYGELRSKAEQLYYNFELTGSRSKIARLTARHIARLQSIQRVSSASPDVFSASRFQLEDGR